MPRTFSNLLGRRHGKRRKHAQAMRTENVRINGSRWNRPCILEQFDACGSDCICNRPPIRARRSRGCNRVASSFLKWCRAIPERAEFAPLWRKKWAVFMMCNRRRWDRYWYITYFA